MNDQKEYSIVPIYSFACTWLLYGLLFGFRSGSSYVICMIISSLLSFMTYKKYPSKTSDLKNLYMTEKKENKITDVNKDNITINIWESIIDTVKRWSERLNNTPIHESLKMITNKVEGIKDAVKLDIKRDELKYLKRFKKVLLDSFIDLEEYEHCYRIENPRSSQIELMRATENKWRRIADVSTSVLAEAYEGKSMEIIADDRVIEQLFSAVEEKSDFKGV